LAAAVFRARSRRPGAAAAPQGRADSRLEALSRAPYFTVGSLRGLRISAIISRTAPSMPISAARAMIEWPMLSSSISGITAMPSMLR
jgi:hypothetical protein